MPPPPIQPAQHQTVPLAQINLQNDDFRITTREDVDDLLPSIQFAGLINPPLLVKHISGYKVVSGFRRINACRKLGWDGIAARILEPEPEHLDSLCLAIMENALHRPLNLIETSRAFQKLSYFLNNNKKVAETASICGLTANDAVIDKIKGLCLLPRPIQNAILKDAISLTMANLLATLESDIAVDLARLFEQLKLSLNKQKELVTLLGEIACREDISIRQVLAHESIQNIIKNDEIDRGLKGRQIRCLLRRRRFPRIVKAEQDYNHHLKQLKLGHDINLIPPKAFEGAIYTLKLNFTSLAHLKALQGILNKIIQHPSLAKILGEDSPPAVK
jgi:ParB/RepB/Spo0J family partition protein